MLNSNEHSGAKTIRLELDELDLVTDGDGRLVDGILVAAVATGLLIEPKCEAGYHVVITK